MVYSAKKVLEMAACDGGASCVSNLVSVTLERMIRENCIRQASLKLAHAQDRSSLQFVKFQSSYEPDVSIEFYINRIHKYSKSSDTCLVIMLIYIDRLIERRGLVLSSLNAHRVILTSLMVAAKYHDDLFYNNAYYAKLGGVPLAELNALELDFLTMHEFSMFVDGDMYQKYFQQLQHYKLLMLQQQPAASPVLVVACNSPIHHPMSQQYSPCRGAALSHSTSCENAFQFSPHSLQSQHTVANHHPCYLATQQLSPSEHSISSFYGQSLFSAGYPCEQTVAYPVNNGLLMTTTAAGSFRPAVPATRSVTPMALTQPAIPVYSNAAVVSGMPMLVPSPAMINSYGSSMYFPPTTPSAVHANVNRPLIPVEHISHHGVGVVPGTGGGLMFPYHQTAPTPQSFHATIPQHTLTVGSFPPSSSLPGMVGSGSGNGGGIAGSLHAAQSYARRVTSCLPPHHNLLSVGF